MSQTWESAPKPASTHLTVGMMGLHNDLHYASPENMPVMAKLADQSYYECKTLQF